MRRLRLLNLFLTIVLLAAAVAPIAYATNGAGGQSASTNVAFQEEPETEQPVENGGAGAAAAMLIVGFVLFLVFIIAVIGAVGLGVVGIGLSITQAED